MMSPDVTKKYFASSLCSLLVVIISLGSLQAQINVLWEARFTSAGVNVDAGKEIAVDGSGNVYVTGTSYTSAVNGYDIVTIKYDPLGAPLWTSTFNGTGSALDEGRDIAVDAAGNVYVTGYTASTGPNYDYITIKYDAAGTQQWATPYNGSGNGFDEAFALAIDGSGNTYVTGTSNAGAQGSNYVTIKYDASGAQQWATSFNGVGNSIDAATQIKLDATDNVYVSGHSYGGATDLDIVTIKYNNAGVQQWTSTYNGALNFFDVPEALFVDNLNNVYVAGATYGGLATENDYVTIKINTIGVQQWAQVEDGPLNEEDKAFDLLVDPNGYVYVTGRSMGAGGTAENMLTFKYDPLGNQIWTHTYDGPASGYDDAQQMRLGASGDLYITGYSAGNGTNNDYLTLKYDTSNGTVLWEARFDGPASNSDQAFAMEIDATESIYVTGTSNDPASNQDYSTIKWCQLETVGSADVAICIGDSTQLSASATGAVSYLWLPSTGLDDNSIANPMANPTVTTTYAVAATNALGCVDVDSVTVTVNPLPSNVITANGPTTFCEGDSVTLTATNPGTYTWMPGLDTTQSITVFVAGNYSVDIIDSNLCMNTGTQIIMTNPLPNVVAGADINVCGGDSVQLNASGALTYTWNTQTTLTDSTIANPLAFPSSQTTYWVIGEDINGCKKADSMIVAVSIAPAAAMSNTTTNDTLDLNLPNGGDIQFFSTGTVNGTGFSWDFGDLGTSSLPNPIYTYTGAGTFTVTLIVSNGGCTDTIYGTIVVLQAISVEENDLDSKVTLYPNPVNETLNVNLKGLAISTGELSLFNVVGKLVSKMPLEQGTTSFKINTNNMPAGVYFLRLDDGTLNIVKRFTVAH